MEPKPKRKETGDEEIKGRKQERRNRKEEAKEIEMKEARVRKNEKRKQRIRKKGEEELERMKREHLNNSRIDSSLSPPSPAIKIRDNRHFSYNSLKRM